MANIPPVPYKTRLTDQSGLLTMPWIAWFRQLFDRVGGNTGQALINPMTAIGDLIYGGSSGDPTKLAGNTTSTKKFLSQTGTGSASASPSWVALSGSDIFSSQSANFIYSGPSSGSAASPTFRAQVAPDRPLTTVSKTTTYTIGANDDVVLCSGSAFTVTLPAADASSGKMVTIKKTDSTLSNVITVSRAGSNTIDGATSIKLVTQYDTIVLISDGSSTWSVISHFFPSTWTSFTQSIQGSTSDPTKANTTLYDQAVWKRTGLNTVRIVYNYGHDNNTGSAAGSGTYLFLLPNSWSVDTSVIVDNSTYVNGVVGKSAFSSTGRASGTAKMYSTTQIALYGEDAADSLSGFMNSGFIALNSADCRISFDVEVPISGWPTL